MPFYGLWPSSPANPPSTGTRPASERPRRRAQRLIDGRGDRSGPGELIIGHDGAARVHPLAGTPAFTSAAATILELRSSPIAATTSSVRGDTSRRTPRALTTAVSSSNCASISAAERFRARAPASAPSTGGARATAAHAPGPRQSWRRQRTPPGSGAHRDAAHGRDDDGRAATVTGTGPPHDLDQACDGVGIGNRRPAKFLYDQADLYITGLWASGSGLRSSVCSLRSSDFGLRKPAARSPP